MKPAPVPALATLLLPLAVAACGLPASVATLTPAATGTPPAAATGTPAPSPSASPEPSPTSTPAILPLEIVEWAEYPYANPADPANTDTHVEVLVRNPNDFPVRLDREEDELRFVNGAGEVVYSNPSPFFYIWEGEWMLPGETAALSACVCFWTGGLARQAWESLELVAPLEPATGIAYTTDVEVSMSEFYELHGLGLVTEIQVANTSDRPLKSIEVRVTAREARGRYVGVAISGAFVDRDENGEYLLIQPGASSSGSTHSEIDYSYQPTELDYEVAAIGILAPAEPTAGLAWPVGTPAGEWNGIPIMPDAIGSEVFDNEYQYAVRAGLAEVVQFYESELSALGFEFELSADQAAGTARLAFRRADTAGEIAIAPYGDGISAVVITLGP